MSSKATKRTWRPRRRSVLVFGSAVALMAAFSVRLVDIQLVQADELTTESQQHTGWNNTIAGVRGSIVDADGNVLAATTLTYTLAVDPSQLVGEKNAKNAEKWPTVAAQIGEITGQLGSDIQQIVADNLAAVPGSQYARIITGLSTSERQKLVALKVPYLSYAPVQARTYPDGAVAANLLGFTGASDDAQGVKGLEGLELTQEACLQASDGLESFQRGTGGEIIPGSLKTTPAEDGGTVQLTINRDLQWYLQQMITEETKSMGAVNGSVTVVEVATGKIRAAAQYPTLDPNNVAASTENERRNIVFASAFEPGSTFKAATAAMLLDSGTVTMDSTVLASGSHRFANGARVLDSFQHGEKNYTLAGALIESSNVGLSMFGEKMSIQERHDYFEKYGVGTVTGVPIGYENPGILLPTSKWDAQTVYNTTFGQALQVNAAQVASFYQAIANDGVKSPLQLVESCTKSDGTVEQSQLDDPKRIMSEQTSAQMRTMIENVAEQGGVADLIKIPGYRIAAKTGTAEIPDGNGGLKVGVYDTSLVGFAPADDPQYVVIVTLKEPTRIASSTATASAFQKAMTQVLKTYQVMPSSTPFTDPLPITQ